MKTISNLIAAGIIFAATDIVHHASAQTWTPTSAPNGAGWTSIASSADGTKLVAVGAYIWDGGGNMYVPFPIYTSDDSGLTWMQTSAPSNVWASVASSADGTRLAAAVGDPYEGNPGSIYISTDSGSTWTQTSAPSNIWSSIAASADGTKLIAAGADALYNPGQIYTSANSGATWSRANAPSNFWASVASSADGTKLAAVIGGPTYAVSPGSIYTSADSGATWAQTTAPSNVWSSIASSADGTKLVAAVGVYGYGSGSIYISADSGATWTQSGAPSYYWASVASSADGTKLVAASLVTVMSRRIPVPPGSCSPLRSPIGIPLPHLLMESNSWRQLKESTFRPILDPGD